MSSANDKTIISSDGFIHFNAGNISAYISGNKGVTSVASVKYKFSSTIDDSYSAVPPYIWVLNSAGTQIEQKPATDYTAKQFIDEIIRFGTLQKKQGASVVEPDYAIHLMRPEGEYVLINGTFIHPNGVSESIGYENYWQQINNTANAVSPSAAGSYGSVSVTPPIKNLPYGKKEATAYDNKKTGLENISETFKDNPLIFLVPIAGLLVLSFVIKD